LDELDEFPPLTANVPSTVPGALDSSHLPTASRGSFARTASDLRDSGVNILSRKPQHKSFTGSSTSYKVLSSVDMSRLIDVFVFRLHPRSKLAEVVHVLSLVINLNY